MAASGGRKGFYIVLGAAVLFIGYQVLRPASTRVEESRRPAPVDLVGPPAIPEDVLGVPPELQAYAGGNPAAEDHCWFLPYAVLGEDQGVAMLEALRQELAQGHGFPERLNVAEGQGALGATQLFRNEPGIARFYITDTNNPEALAAAEARIPLIITQPKPGDANAEVVYLDGHEAIVPLGQFPLSKAFIDALSELDTPEHEERPPGS